MSKLARNRMGRAINDHSGSISHFINGDITAYTRNMSKLVERLALSPNHLAQIFLVIPLKICLCLYFFPLSQNKDHEMSNKIITQVISL
jgi:hypothetical protein